MTPAETTMHEAITVVEIVSLLAFSVPLDWLEQNLQMIMNEDNAVKKESKAKPNAPELSEVCQVRNDIIAIVRVTARVMLAKVTAMRQRRCAKSFGSFFWRGRITSSTNEMHAAVSASSLFSSPSARSEPSLSYS